MRFLAKLQEMADADIRALIPQDTLMRIKQKDPNPTFRAYVVGHEGESEGKIVGVGKMVKRWVESAIHKLVEKMQYGTKIFHSHNEDNRHEGRPQIGEVVAKATQYIKEKLSALAIAYIYPEFKHLPLDVASIEADINIYPENNDSIHAVDVQNITGIALGNSAIQKPGFAGATLVGEIQAFVDRSLKTQFQGGEMTIDEIKKFIKANDVSPSDIFSFKQLSDFVDPEKNPDDDNAELLRKAIARGAFESKKRVDDKFDSERSEWEKREKKLVSDAEKKEKQLNDEIQKLKIENAKKNVGDLFTKIKGERDLSDKQIKFIEKKLDKFEPEKIEDLEKELNAHVDDLVDEFKTIAKDVFDEKIDDDEPQKKKGGAEADDEKKKDITKETEDINPESNPFIPTD